MKNIFGSLEVPLEYTATKSRSIEGVGSQIVLAGTHAKPTPLVYVFTLMCHS
jgi:hypothetical protein